MCTPLPQHPSPLQRHYLLPLTALSPLSFALRRAKREALNASTPLHPLPWEVLSIITSFLRNTSLIPLLRVCRGLRALACHGVTRYINTLNDEERFRFTIKWDDSNSNKLYLCTINTHIIPKLQSVCPSPSPEERRSHFRAILSRMKPNWLEEWNLFDATEEEINARLDQLSLDQPPLHEDGFCLHLDLWE